MMTDVVNTLVCINAITSLILLYLIIPLSKLQGTIEMVQFTIKSHDERIQRMEDKV